jgi:hypothetical protein
LFSPRSNQPYIVNADIFIFHWYINISYYICHVINGIIIDIAFMYIRWSRKLGNAMWLRKTRVPLDVVQTIVQPDLLIWPNHRKKLEVRFCGKKCVRKPMKQESWGSIYYTMIETRPFITGRWRWDIQTAGFAYFIL